MIIFKSINKLNNTIDKVSADIFERKSFNTAIAAIMEFYNLLSKYFQENTISNAIASQCVQVLTKLLSPLTPPISEADATWAADEFIHYFKNFTSIEDYLRHVKKEVVCKTNQLSPLQDEFFNEDIHPNEMEFDIKFIGNRFNYSLPQEHYRNLLAAVSSHNNESNIPGRELRWMIYERRTEKIVGFIRFGSPMMNSKPRNKLLGRPLRTQDKDEMKRKKNRDRKRKSRQKIGTAHELKQQKEVHAENSRLNFAEKHSNDEPENPDDEVSCEHCDEKLLQSTILKHIGHKEACKSHYGPRFEEMKKEKRSKEIIHG